MSADRLRHTEGAGLTLGQGGPKAFKSAEVRQKVEAFDAPDRFQLQGGKGYDPATRQKCLDGSQIIRRHKGLPRSDYLSDVDAELTPAVKDVDPIQMDMEAYLVQRCPRHRKIAVALHGYYRKAMKVTVAPKWTFLSLWQEIVECTDEIYKAGEKEELNIWRTLKTGERSIWRIHGVRSARLCVLKSLIPPEAMHPNPWTWHIHPCLLTPTTDNSLDLRGNPEDELQLETVHMKNKCAPANLDPTLF